MTAPKIAFCTTCRGRAPHLARTLANNISDARPYPNSVFVVMDYGDDGRVAELIDTHHRVDLDSGRLAYYRNSEPPRFRMAHAKNMAHRCGMAEGADILVNLDADNWIGGDFPSYIASKFTEAALDKEAIFLGTRGNWRGPGELARYKTPAGCSGRIAVSRAAFLTAGGYDEVFVEWSPDDKDMGERLGRLGYAWRNIRPCYLRAIDHDSDRRWGASGEDEAFKLKERQHLTIVNRGVIGCGVVEKNFSRNPVELKRLASRIFGIGLHKTATTSLAHALTMLGFECAHWASPHWALRIWDEMNGIGRSPTLEAHYALCDLPIPLLYQKLDARYPGSKFILTLRDEDKWIGNVTLHKPRRKG